MKRRRVLVALTAITVAALLSGRAALEHSSALRIYAGKGYSRLTFDRDGRVLDIEVAPDGRYRVPIGLERVPPACIDAALTFEDRNFFRHHGVDPMAMLRAAAARVYGSRSGGSTITMQLVRLRTGMNTRSIAGKVQQIWRALVLERSLAKEEILAGYFNFAPYGGSIEGIAAASAIYFGKLPERLTRAECAALAVLPQDPAVRFGFRGDRFHQAFTRLADRLAIPVGERSINFPARAALEPPHHARHLMRTVLASGGARSTTIDGTLQRELEQLLHEYVGASVDLGLKNGAILVTNGSSGEVLAYVGSRDFSDPAIEGFVDGVTAKRSPGSLLKPFIYAKAIDEGVIVPDSVLADIPIKLASYEPENFERDFLGLISARRALVKSRNVPALLLNSKLADDGLFTLLNRAGIILPRDAAHYGAAVVLGGIEISLFDAVRLYSAFIARGTAMPLRITSSAPQRAPARLFSPESAVLTREMMATNPPPAGFTSRGIAWKTGTSAGARDAWAIGIAGELVVGVWLGNFDGNPNPNFIGRDLAGPLLFRIVERLRHLRSYRRQLNAPARDGVLNLRQVELCPESGMLRTALCPHSKSSTIIPGVSPIRTCSMHRAGTEQAVFPSEVDLHYRNAGLRMTGAIHRAVTSSPKLPPRIITPEEGVEYRVEFDRETELELHAEVDGEAARVFWYVDGDLIGDSEPGRSLFWKAIPGARTIRVMDTFGASDAVRVNVVPQGN